MDLVKWLAASSWRAIKIYRHDTWGMPGWYSVSLAWKDPGADKDTPWNFSGGDHKELQVALDAAYRDPFNKVPQDG